MKAEFLDELEGVFSRDGFHLTLTKPLRAKLSNGDIIEVPKGFTTDFASVPRFFWRVLPPWGQYSKAAVVHDYLYANEKYSLPGGYTVMVTQKYADELFLELMAVLGVSKAKRLAMYSGLRAFGFVAWNNHRKNDANRQKPKEID